jgi:hypothetical protein
MTILTLRDLGLVGGGVLWTPAQISTALWLDAADASTITTVSGAVSQWNDKSGNGRNASQATATNRPALTANGQNSLNVLTFDGVNDWLLLPDSTNPSGANAVFAACKPNHVNVGCFIIGRAYYWGSWSIISTATGAGVRYTIGRSGIDEAASNVSSLSNNTDKIFTGVYNNANVQLSVNGGSFTNTSYTQNPTYDGRDSTTIGVARNTSNDIASPLAGPLYEIIVLHSAPSQSTIDRVQGYLAHKWGLAANLPSDHPYKTAPPLL